MLKLMYITNKPNVAIIAENAGVDRIFVDMEYIGKSERQGGMDTVQSRHTLSDVKNIASVLKKAELLVRVNPIHDAMRDYVSSKDEISTAIDFGAKIVMLPYFKTVDEVRRFLEAVDGRAKTMLLIETPEAVGNLDDILSLGGIDECHIGLNDLSLGYKRKFMFELLADGTVDMLCERIRKYGIKYGFGGIASLGRGVLPAEYIIIEHYRLGSSMAILSRSFCNANDIFDEQLLKNIFENGVKEIRNFEKRLENGEFDFRKNHDEICKKINVLVAGINV